MVVSKFARADCEAIFEAPLRLRLGTAVTTKQVSRWATRTDPLLATNAHRVLAAFVLAP